MARYLFDGGDLLLNSSGAIAANSPFTVYTARTGGSDVTSDMRAPDGVTTVTVQSDADGEVPFLRGPDGVKILYRDTGTDTRTPWYSAEAIAEVLAGGGGGGVSAHGALTGLGNDDHTQYLNAGRGDARYYTRAQADSAVAGAVSTNSTGDRNRANHTGTQGQSTVDNLVTALTGRAQFVLVSTGSETRPAGSTLVVWVCPTGLVPVNAGSTDLIFSPTSGSTPSDTTAPTIPTGLAASSITSSGATISWTASTDAVGVTAYEVFANSVSKGTSAASPKTLTDLAASTTYAIQVRARDAAGNWSALSTAINVTTSASGGSVEHNVFGASAYPTATKGTDGPIMVANAFYTFSAGANGWRAKGARLYVPAGITMPTSIPFYIWAPSATTPAGTIASAAQTATMTGVTTGQWNEVRFATPITLTPGIPVWVGYRTTDGTYLSAGTVGAPGLPLQSNNTTLLYLAGDSEFSGGRGFFRYDSPGTVVNRPTGWAVDLIIDEGT